MSASPSLRLSLRRKRSTRSGENSGSPAVKKSSPKLPEAKKEPPSTPKTHTSRTSNRPPRSALRTSPRLSRERSRDNSDNEEKNLKTPVGIKWTHENEKSLRQPSPDMPFLSSQLCGTQDCEVVWDCDSPGFSKDDLKRMHGGGEADGSEKAVIITPAPPRQLFPQSRIRPSKAASLCNTTAQLNDLLDLLSSKGKEKRKNESEGDPHSLQKVVPPRDSCSEDSSSSEALLLPKPLRDASSQPFEVPGVSGPKSTNYTASSNDLDVSVWGDNLNLGMCDISDTRSSSEGVGIVKDQAVKSRLSSEKAELSSASIDIFDDDLFSDSVILSTQAVEEALNTKNDKGVTNNRHYSGADYAKGPQHEFNNHNVKGEENSRNINSVKNTIKNSNKSERSTNSKLTTSSLSTNSININQKSSSSDSSPRRQVRRSFRFGSTPTTTTSNPSATKNTLHTLVAIPETQNYVKTKDTRCETKKMNLLPAKCHLEKQSAQSKNLMDRTSKTSSVPCNPSPQGTLSTLRKPLFRHDVKAEEVKNRSTAQGTRGPLLRSQSIGNTRLATSSPVARRSNSSMELDTSQDLEDDEFFKSILSMLPEDEEGFSGDSTLPLSPITTENKSKGFNSSKNVNVNAGLAVESKVSHSIKSSSDRRLTNSVPLQNNVSNGSVRALVMGQVNMGPGATNSKVDPSERKSAAGVQRLRPSDTNYSTTKTKPLDTREPNADGSKEQQTSDTFDDGLFEDDVLSLIDEVESQFGSQNAPSPSPSPQSQPQQIKCTQDEIARKKAAALQRREAKRRQQCR
ncbi:serine-rich adhesin for platelets-like [Scylla paramamosain]|uniref:serine-rich adhesin for platelets-like n=1 Tax=Scylla paramamosain TaxID=85552 RepID=UPI0030830F24